MQARTWIATAIALVMLAALAGAAQAAIHRCRDAHGAIVFTDRGCAPSAAAATAARPRPTVESTAEPDTPTAAVPATAAAAAAELGPPPVLAEAEPVSAPVAEARAPLRPRKAQSGHWFLMGVGLLAALVAYVMHIVAAFRSGSTGWGVALILLSPISNLVYALRRWPDARAGFAVGVAATVVCALAYVPPLDLVEVSDSYTTSRGSTDVAERVARSSFGREETVYLKTVLQWDDWSVGRTHFVAWIWYANDQPSAHNMMQMDFDGSPFVLLGYTPAASLGTGHHRVEVYVDGQLLDQRAFEVM